MKEFFSRLVIYMASLWAVAAAFHDSSPRSITTAVSAVCAYLALDIWWYRVRQITPHDLKLFASFREILPSHSPSVELLRDHDFGNDFSYEQLSPLNTVSREWDNEEHRFHDKALNQALLAFLSGLDDFLREVGQRTAPSLTNSAWQTSKVGAGYDGGQDEIASRKNATVLNELASSCHKQHQEVMKMGVKKLRLQKSE